MRKKIIWIGNSAGFVIDRSLLRLLGLRVGAFVDVETDGRTLILQRSKLQDDENGSPTSNDNAAAAGRARGSVTDVELKRLVMHARKVSEALLHNSVPFEVVRGLFHEPMPEPLSEGSRAWTASLRPYLSWADSISVLEATAVDIATLQRFDVLLEHRKEDWFGGSWEESAEVALVEVPMVRAPDYEERLATIQASAMPQAVPAPRSANYSASS